MAETTCSNCDHPVDFDAPFYSYMSMRAHQVLEDEQK